jgi:hypothetical protein
MLIQRVVLFCNSSFLQHLSVTSLESSWQVEGHSQMESC